MFSSSLSCCLFDSLIGCGSSAAQSTYDCRASIFDGIVSIHAKRELLAKSFLRETFRPRALNVYGSMRAQQSQETRRQTAKFETFFLPFASTMIGFGALWGGEKAKLKASCRMQCTRAASTTTRSRTSGSLSHAAAAI
jgi:hypothetical protein